MDVDHCPFQDVGRGPLDREIHRSALGRGANLPVATRELRNAALASEDRCDDAGLPGATDGLVNKVANSRILCEVRIDERLSPLLRHPNVFRECKGRFAVK